jgi:hypothetical protein
MHSMKIEPFETELTGQWVVEDGRIIADEVCRRIEALISSHLTQIGKDSSGWNTLCRDQDDGRLWERSFPQSHLHGGGPPKLKQLTTEAAKETFGPNL